MQPDTFLCATCRQPVDACACLPEGFTCRECGRIEAPLSKSRRKRKTKDERGLPRWTEIRAWLCDTCWARAKARREYKRKVQAAVSQAHAHLRAKTQHPLYKWAACARQYEQTLGHRMERMHLRPDGLDPTYVGYYDLYRTYLRQYAEHIETMILKRWDYHKAGPLAYPDDLQPNINEVRARLPLEKRRDLHAAAAQAGSPLARSRTAWARVNQKFRKSAPDSEY